MDTSLDMPLIKEIEYRRSDGKTKIAKIVPVEFPTGGLSQEEFAVLAALSEATSGFTPIYAQQQDARTIELFKALENLEREIEDPTLKEKVSDFITLLAVKNSPFDLFGFSNIFPEDLSKFSEDHPIQKFKSLLLGEEKPTLGRNFYPADITKKKYDKLGPSKAITNSTVIRNKKKLEVMLNEERFKNELLPTIDNLTLALNMTSDESLADYIRCKIKELSTGKAEDIKNSDLAWIANQSQIDFVMGSGIENYLDKFVGVRGAASAVVFRVNKEYTEISKQLLNLLPYFEANAPWKHKKEVDPEKLPRMGFVDVLNWTGFYNVFPMMVAAQSLPNNEEIKTKYGTVNMVFVNVQEAKAKVGSSINEEFFLEDEMKKYENHMAKMGMLMTGLHELGHTTGSLNFEGDAHQYFGAAYSICEEARAELFSMWCLPTLVDKGIITAEEEVAGYYSMLKTIISNMQMDPIDHNGARNMMFHYFLHHGALNQVTLLDGGKTKYTIVPEHMRIAVEKMLGEVGDIRGDGDLERLESFKSKYISTELQSSFEQRMADMPLGAGLIFPTFVHNGQEYTGELAYPQNFRAQTRTLGHLI